MPSSGAKLPAAFWQVLPACMKPLMDASTWCCPEATAVRMHCANSCSRDHIQYAGTIFSFAKSELISKVCAPSSLQAVLLALPKRT